MNKEILSETKRIVSSLEPLFYSELKSSERFNLDTIQISTARAREIHMDLSRLKCKLKELANNKNAVTMTTDRHLDSIFNL